MLKIIAMYIGVFVATIITHYSLNWSLYLEGVYVPPSIIFIFTNGLLMIQITTLITLTCVLSKKLNLELLASPYNNFAIGFLFSLLNVWLMVVVVPNFEFLDKFWFAGIILPLLVFSLLIYANHLLFPFKLK